MGTCMKTRGLQMTPHVGKRRARGVRDGDRSFRDHAIDVEHPESDALHVKRANRDGQRCALVEEGRRAFEIRLFLHTRDEGLKALFRGFPMIRHKLISLTAKARAANRGRVGSLLA